MILSSGIVLNISRLLEEMKIIFQVDTNLRLEGGIPCIFNWTRYVSFLFSFSFLSIQDF